MGRTDAGLKTAAAIYVIEFILGTPEEAQAQIKMTADDRP